MRNLRFGSPPQAWKIKDILADPDKDGYNNLNEWILDSDGNNPGSIPLAPKPELVPYFSPFFLIPLGYSYFGFDIKKKLAVIPGVVYTLQRSKDGGKTWAKFKSDTDWTVETVRTAQIASVPVSSIIQVRSLHYIINDDFTLEWIQPPGTENDLYRVKVTLKK